MPSKKRASYPPAKNGSLFYKKQKTCDKNLKHTLIASGNEDSGFSPRKCSYCLKTPCLMSTFYDYIFGDIGHELENKGYPVVDIRRLLYKEAFVLLKGVYSCPRVVCWLDLPKCCYGEIHDHYFIDRRDKRIKLKEPLKI